MGACFVDDSNSSTPTKPRGLIHPCRMKISCTLRGQTRCALEVLHCKTWSLQVHRDRFPPNAKNSPAKRKQPPTNHKECIGVHRFVLPRPCEMYPYVPVTNLTSTCTHPSLSHTHARKHTFATLSTLGHTSCPASLSIRIPSSQCTTRGSSVTRTGSEGYCKRTAASWSLNRSSNPENML